MYSSSGFNGIGTGFEKGLTRNLNSNRTDAMACWSPCAGRHPGRPQHPGTRGGDGHGSLRQARGVGSSKPAPAPANQRMSFHTQTLHPHPTHPQARTRTRIGRELHSTTSFPPTHQPAPPCSTPNPQHTHTHTHTHTPAGRPPSLAWWLTAGSNPPPSAPGATAWACALSWSCRSTCCRCLTWHLPHGRPSRAWPEGRHGGRVCYLFIHYFLPFWGWVGGVRLYSG
jgi:hypothetical protein